MAKRDPFPLQWPDGFARTRSDARLRSRFGVRGQVSFSAARQDLLLELGRLGAANVVLTTDLPVRHDGLPYASGSRAPADPGVAVWFVLADARGNNQERVFACDRWLSHAENMQAIAKSIEAMRGLDRWGMADVVERVMGGFSALPPGDGSEHIPAAALRKRSWREVLGGEWPALDPFELLVLAKSRHRRLIQDHHPDRGGSADLAAELNVALAEAEQELAP